MKYKLIILILLISQLLYSQRDSTQRYDLKLKSIRYSLIFAAGFAEGVKDAISFHYPQFQAVHPNANPNYWDPSISWKNKYKYNDPTMGPKFAGSTGIFVFTTDGWHLTNMVNHLSLIGGSVIIPIHSKKPFKWYAKEFLISYGVNRAGFVLAYNGLYRKW